MNGFLPLLLGIVLLAILAVLLTGVIGMARGGEFNRRHGNRLMRWRVLLQVLAVAIVFILLLNTGSG
jgi:hypothetical protein